MLIGYDFDGVISRGFRPDNFDEAVIITGRTVEEAPKTLAQLQELGIWCPVFFNTCEFNEKCDFQSATHKSKMIQMLNIREFYEDSKEQAALIQEYARDCLVRLVDL